VPLGESGGGAAPTGDGRWRPLGKVKHEAGVFGVNGRQWRAGPSRIRGLDLDPSFHCFDVRPYFIGVPVPRFTTCPAAETRLAREEQTIGGCEEIKPRRIGRGQSWGILNFAIAEIAWRRRMAPSGPRYSARMTGLWKSALAAVHVLRFCR